MPLNHLKTRWKYHGISLYCYHPGAYNCSNNCSFLQVNLIETEKSSELLPCQRRVIVESCFVYKVIRDLESIDHLCINHIRRIGLIRDLSIRISSSGVYKLMFYLAIVNKV